MSGPVSMAPPEDAAASGVKPGQPRLSRWRMAVPAIVLGIALLALWQLVSASGLAPQYSLPLPAQVAKAWWSAATHPSPPSTLGGGHWSILASYGVTTLVESLAGFAVGTLVALPLGYLIARSSLAARALQPYLAASQAVPAVALAPLLVLWLGYGLLPVIALCALIVFFPTVVNTALGLRLLDPSLLDAARMDGAQGWNMVRYIEGPLALPTVLAGLRTSLTLSVTGAVVGEFVLGDWGLGGLLTIARGQFDAPLVFATLVTLAALAAMLFGLARVAERKFSYVEGA
jgi:NitT/TauT family transport system permease protein